MIVIRQRADFRNRPDWRGDRLRSPRTCRGYSDGNGHNRTHRPEAEEYKRIVNHRSLDTKAGFWTCARSTPLSLSEVNVGFSELRSAPAADFANPTIRYERLFRGQTRTSRPNCRISASPPRTDIPRPGQHVRFVPNNRHVNRRSNATRKGSVRRHSTLGPVALLQTVHVGGFHVPSATPQRGNFSLRFAAVSPRQTESPPRFGGLPCRCRWLIRYMPPSITRTVAPACFLGYFLSARNRP
jgi:hypothetical protein